jgi:hypothetical protein
MKSLTRSQNRDTELEIVEGAGGMKGAYSYGVQGRSQREAHNADAKSVDSNSSQKMIIRKDITWTIDEA